MPNTVIIEGLKGLFYVTQGYSSPAGGDVGDIITQGYATNLFITQGYGAGGVPPVTGGNNDIIHLKPKHRMSANRGRIYL